jgi:hypothetical protein
MGKLWEASNRGKMKVSAMRDETEMMIEQFIASRREAGDRIDPETAEVHWEWRQTLDPYGILPGLPEECRQIGRVYFARAPGSDVWVSFYELPEDTRDKLCEKHGSTLFCRQAYQA